MVTGIGRTKAGHTIEFTVEPGDVSVSEHLFTETESRCVKKGHNYQPRHDRHNALDNYRWLGDLCERCGHWLPRPTENTT